MLTCPVDTEGGNEDDLGSRRQALTCFDNVLGATHVDGLGQFGEFIARRRQDKGYMNDNLLTFYDGRYVAGLPQVAPDKIHTVSEYPGISCVGPRLEVKTRNLVFLPEQLRKATSSNVTQPACHQNFHGHTPIPIGLLGVHDESMHGLAKAPERNPYRNLRLL